MDMESKNRLVVEYIDKVIKKLENSGIKVNSNQRQRVIDLYHNSDKSLEVIIEEINKLAESFVEEYFKMKEEKEKKNMEKDNLEVRRSVEDNADKDMIQEPIEDNKDKNIDTLNIPENVTVVGPSTSLFAAPQVKENNSIGSLESAPVQKDNIIEVQQEKKEESSELSAMLVDKSKEETPEIKNTNNMEKPKVYVKQNPNNSNGNNNQGAISTYSVILSFVVINIIIMIIGIISILLK